MVEAAIGCILLCSPALPAGFHIQLIPDREDANPWKHLQPCVQPFIQVVWGAVEKVLGVKVGAAAPLMALTRST